MPRRLALVLATAVASAPLPLMTANPSLAADAALTEVGAPFARTTYGSFYAHATSEAFSSAAVGDVTGDGSPDVVTGGMDGYVRVFDTGGRLVGEAGTGPGAVQSSPVLVDVDRDGVLDVTVGNTAGVVATYGFRGGTARIIWWRQLNGPNGQRITGVFGTPAVTDLNGDGVLDVVVSSWDHYVYAFSTAGNSGAGSILPGWPQHLFDTSWSSPAVGDVDGDGSPDVVVGGDCDGIAGQPCAGSPGGFVWAFRRDGSLIWRHKVDGQVVWSSPALADLNGDGRLDVVVGTGLNFGGSAGSFVLAVEGRSGARMWTAPTIGRVMASPAVGDVDGDGSPEAVVLSEGGQLRALRADGSVLWTTCVDYTTRCPAGHQTHGQAVLADVDADGQVEAVVMAEHHLRVVDARTGHQERAANPTISVSAPGSAAAVALVGGQTWIVQTGTRDVTGNGRGVGDEQVVSVWRTGTALGGSPWPAFKGRYDRRAVYRPDMALDPAQVRSWVGALYTDFLRRAADPVGREHWASRVGSGDLSRAQVAYALATSEEWLGRLVDDFYVSTLGRGPDPSGRAFWIERLRSGMPVAEVAARFYASDEYFSRTGGRMQEWVRDLYRKLLLRDADPSGLQFWTERADRDGRLSVALLFYGSQETLERRVHALYGTLLGRQPDPAGLRTWPAVVHARGDLELAAFLASSAEYYLRAQARAL